MSCSRQAFSKCFLREPNRFQTVVDIRINSQAMRHLCMLFDLGYTGASSKCVVISNILIT